MSKCRELEERLAPFVDGELPPDAQAEVEGHLEKCPPCRDTVRAQADCRALLRDRAARLRCAAPDGLVARCSALKCGSSSARRRTWLPATLAASVLLTLGGVTLYGLTATSGRVLAAQLALDHVKCRTLQHDPPAGTLEPTEAAARFARDYGWKVAVPAAPPDEDARFICVRRCMYMRGRVAHVMYGVGDRVVSLFVIPLAESPPADLAILGQRARAWSDGRQTYAIIADLPQERVARLTQYFSTELARGP
ncbi:MAG: hypothetical protein GEU99_04080 [Luteitalea sp.]|nr:hypothetical protein [Luteitalea sp.]